MIWPAEYARPGVTDMEIDLIGPEDRQVEMVIKDDHVHDVRLETDVVVFQRITHQWLAEAVPVLRRKGIAVVVDIDDNLNSIHPRNPAYESMHPRHEGKPGPDGRVRRHSWRHLTAACREATLVTVSTPALLGVYAKHGRGRVLYNCLPDDYYGLPHVDSDLIGWPAALASHPDDPGAVGGAVSRIVSEGSMFQVIGDPTGVGHAFGLPADPDGVKPPSVTEWPGAVASLGIGVAPLADTHFNACKSWLKPLEMAALGVPCVMSPRAEYERLHKRGVGLLADNGRRWYRHLSQLSSAPAFRDEIRERGREAAGELSLRKNAWRWPEAWRDALLIERGEAPRPAS